MHSRLALFALAMLTLMPAGVAGSGARPGVAVPENSARVPEMRVPDVRVPEAGAPVSGVPVVNVPAVRAPVVRVPVASAASPAEQEGGGLRLPAPPALPDSDESADETEGEDPFAGNPAVTGPGQGEDGQGGDEDSAPVPFPDGPSAGGPELPGVHIPPPPGAQGEAREGGAAGSSAAAPQRRPADDDNSLEGLYRRLGQAGDAESAGRLALRIEGRRLQSGSPTVDLLMRRASVALAAGDLPLAADLADAVVRLDPSYAEGWSFRATVAFQTGDYGKALNDLGTTLALEPRHWQALVGVGMILTDLDDKAGALKAYDAALAIYPLLEEARKAREALAATIEGREL